MRYFPGRQLTQRDIHTDSIGLAVLCSHHQWGFPCRIDTVDLSVVAQQQLETLDVVGEGCCVQWGPAQGKF